jgi:hypothetical protein
MDVLFAERDFIMFVNMKSRHHGTQPAIVIPSFNGGRLHVAIKIWQGGGVVLGGRVMSIASGTLPNSMEVPRILCIYLHNNPRTTFPNVFSETSSSS